VIAATNRSLDEAMEQGVFRSDLFYRLNVMPIHLPPLRERPDDITVLSSRFLQRAAQVYQREPLTMTAGAARWLKAQSWPGNVRQLRQCVERAVLVSPHNVLDVADFSESADLARPEAAEALPPVGSMTMDEIERAMIVKSLRHHGGNISRVAESLGLSRAALYRRFEKYEITV